MTKLRKSFALVAAILSVCIAQVTVADDSGAITPIKSSKGYVYVLATVNISLTTTNTYSAPGGPGQWQVNFMICPTNSSINNTFSFGATDAHDCICRSYQKACGNALRDSCKNTGLAGTKTQPAVTVIPAGPPRIGANLSAMLCTVPVAIWIPSSVLANMGNNNAVPATVLGRPVFISYSNGTTPIVQPSATKNFFAIASDENGNQVGGDDITFTKALIPGGIQVAPIRFATCNYAGNPTCNDV